MKKIIILFVAALVAIVSCKTELEESVTEESGTGFFISGDGESVLAVGEDFVMADPETKTTITQSGSNPPAFAWKEGDVIGVIPMDNETVQSNYKISEISEDPSLARFDGGVWALKKGKEYAAYYPFRKDAVISNESIRFSFLGQTQSANGSLAHLGDYDYMYAGSVVPDDGLVKFHFTHKISLVRLQLTVPEAGTYKKVILGSSENWFSETTSMKLSDGTMTDSDIIKTATINLDDIEVEKDGVLTVWFAMRPTTVLNGKAITVDVYSSSSHYGGEISIASDITEAKAYSYSAILQTSNSPEYVDLGLSVMWATCNVGADGPSSLGNYYQWGGLRDKSGDIDGWDEDIYPSHDNSKSVLDATEDIATVTYGPRWRIPTDEEWAELINNCTWTWDGNGERITSKIEGYAGKSIYLPATGVFEARSTRYYATEGYYWSSTLDMNAPGKAYRVRFNNFQDNNTIKIGSDFRSYAEAVRPVYDPSIKAHPIVKIPGQPATVEASGWKDYYQCTECGEYFEDSMGVFRIGGEEELTTWKSEGGNGYLPKLPPDPVFPITEEYVDLGLPSGILWATCNIGASKPWAYGGYYQWGGTENLIDSNVSNYPSHDASKPVLDPAEDIASIILGSRWRIPTDAEWLELKEHTTRTWTSNYNDTGVAGRIVTSTVPGYTDKHIFLPAAGRRLGNDFWAKDQYGYYWSSSLNTENPEEAFHLFFSELTVNFTQASRRKYAESVRPVFDPNFEIGTVITSAGLEGMYVGDIDGKKLIVATKNLGAESKYDMGTPYTREELSSLSIPDGWELPTSRDMGVLAGLGFVDCPEKDGSWNSTYGYFIPYMMTVQDGLREGRIWVVGSGDDAFYWFRSDNAYGLTTSPTVNPCYYVRFVKKL